MKKNIKIRFDNIILHKFLVYCQILYVNFFCHMPYFVNPSAIFYYKFGFKALE